MAVRIHGTNPEDPGRCPCGQLYPQECRGGFPILRDVVAQRIWELAGQGVSFPRIAERTGLTVHTVRREQNPPESAPWSPLDELYRRDQQDS